MNGAATTLRTRVGWGSATAEELVSELLGRPVELARACPGCGSDAHGRPYIVGDDGIDVSIAHAGDLTLVGVRDGGRVGVDIELASAPVPAHIEHPDDAPASVELWVRKEAYLKATGEGLRREPTTVGPAEPGASWRAIDVGPDYRAAICELDR